MTKINEAGWLLMEEALRQAIADTAAIEKAVKAALQAQGMRLIDAPFGVASAVGRLENVREDLQSAIVDLRVREALRE